MPRPRATAVRRNGRFQRHFLRDRGKRRKVLLEDAVLFRRNALIDLQALTRFLPMGVGDGMLRFNGIGERGTWGMYNNDTPTEAQKEDFYRVAKWTAERGMALTVHWNNDRSVHHLLDVLERVDREVPIRDLRWSVAHLHDASDASLLRMKALGVGWLMQNGLYFAASSFLADRGPQFSLASLKGLMTKDCPRRADDCPASYTDFPKPA